MKNTLKCIEKNIPLFLKKHWTFLKKHWTFSKIPRDVFFKTTVCFFGAISKRGNKYARYILFNCSQMVVKLGASNYPEHPVYIYYQNKKAEGKHYYESLTACSTKILRMLYSMCKNNKQFLEN